MSPRLLRRRRRLRKKADGIDGTKASGGIGCACSRMCYDCWDGLYQVPLCFEHLAGDTQTGDSFPSVPEARHRRHRTRRHCGLFGLVCFARPRATTLFFFHGLVLPFTTFALALGTLGMGCLFVCLLASGDMEDFCLDYVVVLGHGDEDSAACELMGMNCTLCSHQTWIVEGNLAPVR